MAQVLKAKIVCLSGSLDEQLSADVNNVSDLFKVHADIRKRIKVGEGDPGGAMTNTMLETLSDAMRLTQLKDAMRSAKTTDRGEKLNISWDALIKNMHKIMSNLKLDQLPQVTASFPMSGTEPFRLKKSENSQTRGVLIGINYSGTPYALDGCHMDVVKLKAFLELQGYSKDPKHWKILIDDGKPGHESPTKENIRNAFKWLHDQQDEADSMYFHFSGHGGTQVDRSGDERDGQDETLMPLDYEEAGEILDDAIYSELLYPLQKHVQLIATMDCCHSGTIFDLPYSYDLGRGEMVDHEKWKLNKIARKMHGVREVLGTRLTGLRGGAKGLHTHIMGNIGASIAGPLVHIKGYLAGGIKNAKTAKTMSRGYLAGGVKNAKNALTFLRGRAGRLLKGN